MHRSAYRYALILILLVSSTLACSFFNNISRQAGEIQGTAVGVATQAQALATTGSQLLGTAEAFATQNPGLFQTAEAFATQQGPKLLATGQALATSNPGFLQTVEAAITQGLPTGEAPQDIPVYQADQALDLYTANATITYHTPADLQTVVDFYRTEMANNGWTLDEGSTVEAANVVVLTFQKPERTANVTITYNTSNNNTYVTVLVTNL
ncbi:MAG: hypothetical protein EHM70_21840 [Chloroflexota bacterium]|nr:MAG: hypothetical protein EHM70_21840 [Chloroflexota bacterium]